MKDIFSSIAKKYERFNVISSFGAYKLWLAGMMRQAPISPTDDVLDIAGGTGDVTFAALRASRPTHIQCTDLVPEMLDVARAHLASEPRTPAGDATCAGVPVAFEVVDAQDIPYADESYDAVTMAYGIRNMPDRPRALFGMYRVLKPGGALVCLEFSTPPNAAWRALYNFYLKHLIPFLRRSYHRRQGGVRVLGEIHQGVSRPAGPCQLNEAGGFRRGDVEELHRRHIAAVHVAIKSEGER